MRHQAVRFVVVAMLEKRLNPIAWCNFGMEINYSLDLNKECQLILLSGVL
jgi:hypothetical protein